MGAIANLGTRSVAVAPGAQASAEIKIRNNGTVVDQFSIAVLGDAGAWSTAEPPVVSLFPGAEGTARITFRPPRTSSVPAGPMPFGIRVASQEDPAGSVVEEGVLQIGPFADTSAELAPRTSRGRTGATHDLAVDNRGNVPLNATITGLDPDRVIAFDIRPPSVLADPGNAAFAKVRVKPRKRFWRGQPKTRSFQLQLDSQGQPPVLVGGSMLQESILPSWLIKALLLALAALIALVLIWFLFLRPVIQSTAQERTDQALQQAGIPIPSAGQGGNPGGQKTPAPAAPTPTPKAGTTNPPAQPTPTPAALGAQTPRDGRLDANGDGVGPTPGKTLYVTDLVFSNPDGSTGALTLRRNNQDLLDMQLENFRDLDYHFVSPIVIGKGQQLRLACDGACLNAGLYFSGYER